MFLGRHPGWVRQSLTHSCRDSNVAEVWPLASLQTSMYTARKAASAPESRSTVSTLSTFSSQSNSANGYRFLALTLWYHVGTNLAFEGDATFE